MSEQEKKLFKINQKCCVGLKKHLTLSLNAFFKAKKKVFLVEIIALTKFKWQPGSDIKRAFHNCVKMAYNDYPTRF